MIKRKLTLNPEQLDSFDAIARTMEELLERIKTFQREGRFEYEDCKDHISGAMYHIDMLLVKIKEANGE